VVGKIVVVVFDADWMRCRPRWHGRVVFVVCGQLYASESLRSTQLSLPSVERWNEHRLSDWV